MGATMIRSQIRMRHLRTFVEVAQNKSITRAAEFLHTAQPNVSRTIREMEDALGHPLFERVGRGLVLTAVGKVLLSHVQSGLEQVERGLDMINAHEQGARLSVLMTPNVSRSIAPGAVIRFKEVAPGVRLRIETTASGGMADRVRAGEVDLGVGKTWGSCGCSLVSAG